MSFWSDPLGAIVKHVNGIFNSVEDGTTPTEQTAAPQNINPINFDITAKTLIDLPIAEIIPNEPQPPPEVQSMINKFINILASTPRVESEYNEDSASASITAMDFADKDGHTLVKIIEDTTGKAIEIVHEITSVPLLNNNQTFPTTIKDLSNAVVDSLNTTTPKILHFECGDDDTSYIDVYIIVALVLLILTALCCGVIVWCRKNKLKPVKRHGGEYPVAAKHLNNQILSNTEKLKNVP